MGSRLSRPASGSSSSGLARKVLSTGTLRLVIVPLAALSSIIGNSMVMRSVGLSTFGVVSLIITLPNLVPFMDLGLGTSLVNAFGTQSPERAAKQAKVAWSMLLVVAATVFCVCTLLQFTVGWGRILGVDLSAFDDWGLVAFFFFTLAAVPLGLGQRILTGLNQVPVVTMFGIVSPLVNLPLLWFGAHFGVREIFLFAPAAATTAMALGMFLTATRKARLGLAHWAHPTWGTKELRREIAMAAGPMVVISAGLPLAFETHRLVLARLAAGQLGDYSVAMVLYTPVLGIAVQMASNLWPYFNGVRAEQGAVAAHGAFWRLQRLVAPIAVVYVTGFVVLAPLVNRLWSRQAVPTSLWVCLGLLMFAQIVQYVPGMYLTDPVGLRLQAACVTAMCVLTLVVMLLVTRRLGALGPVLASVVGILVGQLVPEWVHVLREGRRLRLPRRAGGVA